MRLSFTVVTLSGSALPAADDVMARPGSEIGTTVTT